MWQEEGGNLNTCNKCNMVMYCNAACKKRHFSKHKKTHAREELQSVPSGKMQFIVQEFETLILFLSRSHWKGMNNQLVQVSLHAVPLGDFDEADDNIKTAADKLLIQIFSQASY